MNLQRMIFGIKAVGDANLALQCLDGRAHKLRDSAALRAHQMVMAHACVYMLVKKPVAAESTLLDKAIARHQVEIAVEGGAGDLAAARRDRPQQLLSVDMAVVVVDLTEKLQALRRNPVPVTTQYLEEAIELWKRFCQGTVRWEITSRPRDLPSCSAITQETTEQASADRCQIVTNLAVTITVNQFLEHRAGSRLGCFHLLALLAEHA